MSTVENAVVDTGSEYTSCSARGRSKG